MKPLSLLPVAAVRLCSAPTWECVRPVCSFRLERSAGRVISARPAANDMRWDVFEILGPKGETVDFSGNEPGKFTPIGWSTVGYGRNASEWEVVEDSGSTGGRHLRYSDDQLSLSVLKYEGPGTVEGGNSYRLKIVVGDARDVVIASAILIEAGSIQVIPE